VEEIKKCMMEVLQDVWAHINDEFFMSLFELMQRRCKTMIETEGWYTKY
jgi:hypothetical protein